MYVDHSFPLFAVPPVSLACSHRVASLAPVSLCIIRQSRMPLDLSLLISLFVCLGALVHFLEARK
jgi:hypothetical protein